MLHDHDTSIVAELLRDADGDPLGDESLAMLSASDPSERATTAMPRARLHWGADEALVLPLRRIASHEVAMHFGFEPGPALAMRLDLDTRR